MTIETTMALMAAGSYWDVRRGALNPTTGIDTDNDAPIPPGWKVLTQYDISGSGSNSSILSDGFSARVYQNISTGEVVISYAGTEFGLDRPGFYDDFISGNIPSALGEYGQQAYLAADLYQRVKADPTLSDNISFTGHSLGGGLASMMAVWYDRPAYVFAPAPFERSVDISQVLGIKLITGAMTGVKAKLLLSSGSVDPAFLGYNPLTEFSAREANVKAWAIKGEVLEDGLTRFSPGIVDWIEAPGRVSLFKDSTTKLSAGDKHSIDLHAAALLSDKFQTEAGKLPTALERLMDKNLYGGDVLGNKQVIITKLIRNEVGVRDDSGTQVLLAANDMLTHFANDLGKLGANMAGLNQAAQDAILAQDIEWYYWQGTDYAGQEFFSQTGELLQYTSAQGAGLINAQNKALSYVRPWLNFVSDGAFGGSVTYGQWNVIAGSSGSTATAKDVAKSQIFIGGTGGDTFTGGNKSDAFYASAGDDSLNGGASDNANDWLSGGAGNDTYKFTGAFGSDVVIDSDGRGSIEVDGVTLQGGKKLDDNSWYNKEQGFVFVLLGSGADKSLLIRRDSSLNYIRVQGWQNGQLGLTMDSTLAELPEVVKIFLGDQRGKLVGSEIEPDVTPDQPSFGIYKWSVTSWAADGTLTGGVAQANFADVIYGTAGNDKIDTKGGNDAGDGRAGNDIILGGDGDDKLAGGLGSDDIQGGTGDDLILSAYGLVFGQRSSANDGFLARDYSSGDLGRFVDQASLETGKNDTASSDAIDAGDGNDAVVAGGGADRVQGGAGDDVIWGMGGGDIIEGDQGDDTLFGDGYSSERYLGVWSGVVLDVNQHGDDFIDGGEGADKIEGGGGADQLFGGAGNDVILGDSSVSEVPDAYHGNDYLDGEDGDDILVGGGKDDTVYGGAGNDVLHGDTSVSDLAAQYHGNDYLDGEDGNDKIFGDGGSDTLYGGAGDDELWGDTSVDIGTADYVAAEYHGDDYIDGEDGDDYAEGGGGADTIYGGDGADVLWGDANASRLEGAFHGADYIDGEAGNDTITGNGGADTLYGGTGDDIIRGDAFGAIPEEPGYLTGEFHGDDALDGEEGDDQLWGDGGSDTIYGGDGNDILHGDAPLDELAVEFHGNDMLDGGNGDDKLYGDAGDDILDGGDGNDLLVGGDGVDYMDGGEGNDVFEAGAGDTVVDSGGTNTLTLADGLPASTRAEGSDLILDYGDRGVLRVVDALAGSIDTIGGISVSEWLEGNLEDDVELSTSRGHQKLTGGGGDDQLTAGHGFATLLGGGGRDTLFASGGNSTLRGGAGDDVLEAGGGGNDLNGGAGDDVLQAGDGDDTLDGGSGNDTLSGGAGNDTLIGGEGNDTLDGGDGNDRLFAGSGQDTLTGGAGLDTYVLSFGTGHATVVDGSIEGSVIELDGPGLQLESLTASRHQNDLLVEARGGVTSMLIKDYYGPTQTSWLLKDAQGNTVTADALVEASRPQWDTLRNSLLQDFKIWAKGEISNEAFLQGYSLQSDGTWFRPAVNFGGNVYNYSVDVTHESRNIHHSLPNFSSQWVTNSSYTSPTYWNQTQWDQGVMDDSMIAIDENVQAASDSFISLTVPFSTSVTHQNAWRDITWTNTSITTYTRAWQYTGSYTWSDAAGANMPNPTEYIDGYQRNIEIAKDYVGVASALSFQDPGAPAMAGELPSYLAVDYQHAQITYGIGETVLSDGDHTVMANQYAAVIGGVGNNIIYGAGFAYGGTGNAQLIGGGTLMAGTGDQYLQGGRIMVVGDGHDTVVGRTGSHILVNPDNQGVDLIAYDFNAETDTDGLGRSLTVGDIYQAMGYQDWRENFIGGGKFYFQVVETFSGYFDSIEDARAAFNVKPRWLTFDEAMARDDTKWRYVEPLTVLYTTPYSSFGFGPGSDYQPSSYYDTHPVPAVVLTANNFAVLQPLVDADLMPGGVVSFGPGLALADLTLSWGEVAAPLDGATHVTLDITWGTDQGIRIMMPRTGDALNSVIRKFEFSDGTVSGLLDLIALAPPMPDLDVGYAHLYAGMGTQTSDAADLAGIRAVVASTSDIQVESDGVDLLISIIGSSDSLRISGWYADSSEMSQAILFTSGGAMLSAAEMTGKGLLKDGSAGSLDLYGVPDFATTFIAGPNTRMTGASGRDTYIYEQGSGEVHITDPGGGTVRFGSGISTAATLGLDAGSLVIRLGNQGDMIHLENFDPTDAEGFWSVQRLEFDGSVLSLEDLLDQGFDLSGTSDADTITGTSVTDRILAGAGDDVLQGGEGDDTLDGGAGSDVYLFSRGDGFDTVNEDDSTAGNVDTIRFDETVAVSDVRVSREGLNLYLSMDGSTDRIEIGNWFGEGADTVEQVEFADGTIWSKADLEARLPTAITGTEGDDQLIGSGAFETLEGLSGNDVLSGGAGNDVYLFKRGDGQDIINDYDETLGNIDAVRFDSGISAADVRVTRDSSSNLFLSIDGTQDRIQLGNWFEGGAHQVERVLFADGTMWGPDDLVAMAQFGPTEGGDYLGGTEETDFLYGQGGNDFLSGEGGGDFIDGGSGNDYLQGGAGDDYLADSDGSNYYNGGAGDDTLQGSGAADLLMGGAGNDIVTGGDGPDVIAFNIGDGQDTLNPGGAQDDTVSLGGAGLDYANLSLQKNGNDLVLKVSGTDQLTFSGWYDSTANQSVLNLQLVAEAMSAFDANSSDPLLNKKVQTFDFQGLVGAFDAARTATPGLSSWALSNGLTQFHLAGSDSEALGGDLAYHYGADGTLAGMGLGKAQEVLTNAQFGAQAQGIHSTASLQEGLVRLG
ncbi:calcium-binding protein [Polaromonas sp. CT11-55]|uniref:calcium-binding protein n=1 Tax=Polaromonas sp. CT11-55 TaxID=3243045 RepID=UPI0039A7041C